MKQTGMILTAAGAALTVYAMFVFDPSIEVSSYGGYGGGRVVNMDLQQRQLMMAIAGGAMFVAGIVLYGMSHLASSAAKATIPKDILEPPNPVTNQNAYTDEELAELGVIKSGNGYLVFGQTFATATDAVNSVRMERLRAKLG